VRVVEWAQGDQQSGVPTCPGRINAPQSGSGLLFTTDRYGNEVVAPSGVTCGMNSIMQQVEYWAHAEGSAVLGKLPPFDRHDQRAIEGAQQALLAIGGTLGLKSAANSDGGFTLASNTDLTPQYRAQAIEAFKASMEVIDAGLT
jgi:hypothetical protein